MKARAVGFVRNGKSMGESKLAICKQNPPNHYYHHHLQHHHHHHPHHLHHHRGKVINYKSNIVIVQ